jgi:hypothetical protein
MMNPVITLTTDFGTRDSYVGVMKGVILGICPTAQVVDISHEIPPQNIAAAAFVLRTAVPYFPPGTVHLVVVDPGVGSERQPVAFATPEAVFVGPDNGIFGALWQQARERWSAAAVQAVRLEEPRFRRPDVSATFHGRDIFAPAAAHLAAGVPLQDLGPPLDELLHLPTQQPTWETDTSLVGAVVYIDHFGNCITNITAAHLEQLGAPEHLTATVRTHHLPLAHTYASVSPGEALALVGSSGHLEIAVRDGSASHTLAITPGTAVKVEKK